MQFYFRLLLLVTPQTMPTNALSVTAAARRAGGITSRLTMGVGITAASRRTALHLATSTSSTEKKLIMSTADIYTKAVAVVESRESTGTGTAARRSGRTVIEKKAIERAEGVRKSVRSSSSGSSTRVATLVGTGAGTGRKSTMRVDAAAESSRKRETEKGIGAWAGLARAGRSGVAAAERRGGRRKAPVGVSSTPHLPGVRHLPEVTGVLIEEEEEEDIKKRGHKVGDGFRWLRLG